MTDQFCILELLGHRRLVGLVSECEIAGAGCLRIDVMNPEGGFQASQFYFPAAVYGITITTEEAVRAEVERQKARPALTPYAYPVREDPWEHDEAEAPDPLDEEE